MASNLICSVRGCDGLVKARGYCTAHYEQAREHKFEKVPIHLINRYKNTSTICFVKDCNRKTIGGEYCKAHYQWYRYHGFKKRPTHIIQTEVMMDTSHWSRENLAWISGLIEGEGTIYANKKSSRGRIALQMTDEDTVRRAAKIAGYGLVCGPYRSKHRKDVWVWGMDRREYIYAFICAIYPWLGIRRKQQARNVLANIGYVANAQK